MLTVSRVVCARIPVTAGEFQLCLFTNSRDDKEHLAIIMGDVRGRDEVLVRVHSECFTGDLLGSQRCDCGDQFHAALNQISEAGQGVLLYLRQEGRGIGLQDKLRAYNLQDIGYDTVDANLLLGHQADERDYTVAAKMLEDLGVQSVRLMTNNPEKIAALQDQGMPVTGRVSLTAGVNPENLRYLETKATRMKHLLNLAKTADSPAENPNGQPG